MDTTDAPAYGTPEAKARIKELKALEAPLNADLRDRSPQGAWHRDRAAADLMYRQLKAYERERIALQTAPLPCSPWDLPAYMLRDADPVARGPQDAAAYQAGDRVTVYSRGGHREAVVVEARRTNLEVAYTTATALREATERQAQRPDTKPNVTRKTVKLEDVYNHVPQQHVQPEPPAPTVAPVATLAGPRQQARAERLAATDAPLGADEQQALRDTMAAHKDGWRTYHTARTQLAELVAAGASVGCTEARRDIMAAYHDDYTAYRRAYRQLLALQKARSVPVHEEVVAA